MPHDTPLAGPQSRTEENNQWSPRRGEPRPDAFEAALPRPLVRDTVRDRRTNVATGVAPGVSNRDLTALSVRDRAALRHLVLLRVLTYAQLHRIAYAGVHPSVTRRRMRHLEHAGWLTTTEFPQRQGGHQRYAHPTKRTIDAVLAEFGAAADGAAYAPLIRMMLPRSGRTPLDLHGAVPPKWLAHQREVNSLLATQIASGRRILWASSWDCPFSSRHAMFTLPQPDYVLVEETDDSAPRLIFGEHDRGNDTHFAARKAALYAALAAFPDVCAQLFGIRSFSVHVTVLDAVRQRPIARMRSLMRMTRATSGADIFRFTLAGWLFTYGTGTTWFDRSQAPLHDSVRMRDHGVPVERVSPMPHASAADLASGGHSSVAGRHTGRAPARLDASAAV